MALHTNRNRGQRALVSSRIASLMLVGALGLAAGSAGRAPISHSHAFAHFHGTLGTVPLPGAPVSRFEGGQVEAQDSDPELGGRPIAHFAGGRPLRSSGSAKRPPRALLYRTGHAAAEPTLGFSSDGTMFLQSYDTQSWPAIPSDVLRSSDGGRTWDVATPPQHKATHTFDPYLYVDPRSDRVFTADFLLPCHRLSYSDDQGSTWTTSVMGCQVIDHQTLFGGPPVTSDTGDYPSVLYYCGPGEVGSDIGVNGTDTLCLKSVDGGDSWSSISPPFPLTSGCYGGGTGHGVVGSDGTIYLGRADHCGRPTIAISHNEGETWSLGVVSEAPSLHHEGAVAVDAAHNLYYLWTSSEARHLPYLAVSKDRGKTWSDPMMVAHPSVATSSLPTIVAGEEGRIALAYMGSVNARAGSGENGATWNGYIGVSTNALSSKPVFVTSPVNDPEDPLLVGLCFQSRCGLAYDFIDVTISPDGFPWVAMVDGCFEDHCISDPTNGTGLVDAKVRPGEGIVATLRGSRLR